MPNSESVVLNCAGVGSRLGLGSTKTLINIVDKPLIWWHLKAFEKVEDLRIVVGYQAKEVISEVLKIRKDVLFVFNHDYFNTKTGASFWLGAKDANEYVIEWDGDLLVHPEDAQKCLSFQGEFVGYSDISSQESVYVNLNNKGEVINFSRDKGDFEWTGPACIKEEKLTFTKDNVFNQFEKHLPMNGLKIRAKDIDTYNDYLKALEFVKTWQ